MKPRFTKKEMAGVAQSVKHAKLVEASRKMARIVRHADPDKKTCAGRTRFEKNMPRWMKHHGGPAFDNPWSDDHKRVLKKLDTAVNDGGTFAVAMPRGQGKSTICKWAMLYVLLTGRRRFAVIVAATAELAQAMVDFVRQQVIESDSLHKHYPHVTTYARATDGKAIKARYQLRADGKASGIQWSKTTLVFPEIVSPTGKPYPSNGAILEGHGLTGAIRGKWRDTKTGKVLRPDFVILDDPQDRISAESPTQCVQRERIITGDVLGLAGPKKRIAAVMPCTIICKGDLADRFLDHTSHPEWQGEVCNLVRKWPDSQEVLWKEYAEIYKEEAGEGRGQVKASRFYRANRAAMDAGAVVSWPARVRDGEISALQTAENILIEMGDQFYAEMQNNPRSAIGSQYELTTDMVMVHAVNIPRLHIPESSTIFVGHCDINRSGLHWALAAFSQDMTGHCPAYGRWPPKGDLWEKNATERDRKQSIFRGLRELCSALTSTVFMRGSQRVRVGMLLIDRGYEPLVVHQFCEVTQFKVMPARGYAAHKYWPRKNLMVGKPMEGCHKTRSQVGGEYIAFNADLWRETAQRAFLADPGAPGGFTLFKAPDARYHYKFAEQIIAEKLTNKYKTDAGLRWEWRHAPGTHWDWGDALTGCWVAAAAAGLSPSGQPVIRKRQVETRKCKVDITQ